MITLFDISCNFFIVNYTDTPTDTHLIVLVELQEYDDEIPLSYNEYVNRVVYNGAIVEEAKEMWKTANKVDEVLYISVIF